MRRLYKYAWVALAGTLMAISCNKTMEEPASSEDALAPVTRTFTCVYPGADDPDAKVSIADDGTTGWQAGDKIRVHAGSSGNESIVVTLTADDISANKKKAKITIEGLDPYDRSDKGYTSTYYAAYPSDLVAADPMYYNTAFTTSNYPLMAGYNDGDVMVFHNLCGLITFTVSGDFDQYSIKGKNGENVGYSDYQVRLTATTTGTYLKYVYEADGHKPTAVKTMTGSVVSDGSTVNTIGLATGTNFSDGFIITFFKDGTPLKTVSTNGGYDIARGKLLKLGNVTEHLKDYVAPTTSDHTYDSEVYTSVTDLGAGGTANCYVISAAGSYKLPVVKGNSATSAGNIFGVELLWETWNNSETVAKNSVIAAVDFDGPSNYVYFKTPATLKPGNALIAAKDNLDNIIWSWHIWVPATTVTYSDYGIYTAGKAMCDRNLGALDVAVASPETKINVTSVGLVYQWGRKDPFPGPSSIETEGEYYGFAAVAGAKPAAVTTQLSVEDAIKQPNTFAKGSSSWTTSSDITLWGDEASKTIYDPCPAGYRVPNRVKDNDNQLFKAKLSSAAGWSYNATKYWFTLGSPATVFPCSGYCDGGSFKATFRTVIWNAHPDGDNGYNIYVYAGPAFANYSHAKSRGYFVRCVAE